MTRGATLLLSAFIASGATVSGGLPRNAQQQIEARYQKTMLGDKGLLGNQSPRFVEDIKTVLVVVAPQGIPALGDMRVLFMRGVNLKFDVDIRNGEIFKSDEFDKRLSKGSILGIWDLKFKSDRVELWCRTPEPVQMLVQEKVVGMYLSTKLRFYFDKEIIDTGEVETIIQAIDKWVVPFTSREEANQFASNVAVPEISVGMTVAEVEQAFGLPDRRANLGQKVIYQYVGMIVEFVDGKVSNVKF